MSMKTLSSCSTTSCKKESLPNPNPKNYKIVNGFEENDFTVIEVHYPDCTNFEGIKILVFSGNILEQVKRLKELDPHFCGNHLSPIARFAPNIKGFMALEKLLR